MEQNQVKEWIKGRRSIYPKQLSGQPVDDSLIEILLENANWAPTHRFTEPWRFKVFKGNSLAELVRFKAALYQKKITPEEAPIAKLEKFSMIKERCSHIIAIIMKRDEQQSIPEIEEICSVACAVQNIYLSLSSLELGGYWSTGNGTFSTEMHDYLGLGPDMKLMGFFYLGHHSNTNVLAGKRGDWRDKVEWLS